MTAEVNLDAALALAGAGIKIFPAGTDKRPLVKHWQEIATTDEDQIRGWWERVNALPAIPCGTNGIVVIDLDRHAGGADGVPAFKQLIEAHGPLPAGVPTLRTPSGGLHLFFRQPDGEPFGNGRGDLPAGIDVRGAGGFVIGLGAVLPDGRGWREITGRSSVLEAFKTRAAPILDGWIKDIIRPPQHAGVDDIADAGETNDARGRAYASTALQEIEAELATTLPGGRNERLYKSAFRLGTMVDARLAGRRRDCFGTAAGERS